MLTTVLTTIALTLVPAACCSSMGEWTLHRYIMHRPLRILLWVLHYPFRAHAQVHHVLYKADTSYHLGNRDDYVRSKIRMAWWNGPFLIIVGGIPFYLVAYAIGMLTSPLVGWTVGLTTASVFAANYVAYESLHWCMHLPKARRVEFTRFFRRLNGHHVLHHRYMGSNFNVVLPLADWMFGTLLMRGKTSFRQVSGSMVPDLQPLAA